MNNMKILVVDDSKAMRTIVSRTLRQAGFGDAELVEAENGAIALELVKAGGVDLVLSDWNMPEMNGIELLHALNDNDLHPTFGFVTSESSPDMRKTASDAGAQFLISKPFTPEIFESTLKPLL
jgi:two-component system chemotaxis response regulator CheY